MKSILTIFVSFLIISCNPSNYKEKFNDLRKKDFSIFKGYSITYRNGVYLISNANLKKDEKRIFIKRSITKKIKSIIDVNNKDITKSESDIKLLEILLDKFDILDVSNLSVDNFENVSLVFFNKKCQFSFLKLSPQSTLHELNKDYYKEYNNNWFLYKQCEN